MSDVDKADDDPIRQFFLLMVIRCLEQAQAVLRVVRSVDRFHHGKPGALVLTVPPLRFLFLDMGGVFQHDPAELFRCRRRHDAAAETVFIKQRKVPGMVDMRMGQQDKIDAVRRNRQIRVDPDISSLFHSVIDQDMLSRSVQIMTAACYLTVSADKFKDHFRLTFSADAAGNRIRNRKSAKCLLMESWQALQVRARCARSY